MPCLLLILSLYSIQNCYPLQTGTLQGFESSCPLLKKDFGKNYCPCPLLKKQLLQKYSSCLLLKKQIKNKYFSCLLFLTTTFVHSISGKNVLPGAFQLRKSGRRHAYFSVFNGVFILPRGLYGGARSPALRAFNGLQVFVLLLRSVHTRKAKGKAAPVPHIIQKAQLHHGAAAHGKRTFPV